LVTKNLELKNTSPVGRHDEHLLLIVEDENGNSQKVVWWQGTGWELPEGRFDLAYAVRTSNYRGLREVQVEWLDARLLEEPSLTLKSKPHPIEVVDLRGQPHPLALLKEITTQVGIQVWSEAQARGKLNGRDRYELSPSRGMVIWTTPPGPRELQAALELTKPEVVYLIGVAPETDNLEAFLKRLAGLVKYTIKSTQGKTSLSRLAAAMAQREVTVRKGLDWLVAHGNLVILSEIGDDIEIAEGSQCIQKDITEINLLLKIMLDETSAYRSYFASADKESVLG
jgi:single-stranded-DNA-specific exonuclease